RAGAVVDLAAGSAHQVVVIVVTEQLEAAGRAFWLDPTKDMSIGERVQDVVDRLDRRGPQPVTHRLDDRLGRGVRVRLHLGENCQAWPGDPKVGLAQQLSGCEGHEDTVACSRVS